MRIKKSLGKVYGAELTAAERKAMNLDALLKRYEMDDDDRTWLCTFLLKKLGIDIELWDREKG